MAQLELQQNRTLQKQIYQNNYTKTTIPKQCQENSYEEYNSGNMLRKLP
jgi:hypothetical protein